ncbi:MAG: 5-(carboxyamino)imidazole ribonucleotide synthase [Saccharospirillum sp.]
MHIGVIGGGQLGRMMALAALPLGVRLVFLDPSEQACASATGTLVQGAYDDAAAVARLLTLSERVTFEFENVPPSTIAQIAEQQPAYPSAEALATARDRWAEKQLFRSLGIDLPPVAAVNSQDELEQAVADIGLPAVLKTRTLGYDGKGQAVLREAADVVGAYEALGRVPLVLEGFVDFDHEVSAIGVRSIDGDIRCYPLVHNEHRQGMLYRSQPLAAHPLQAQAEAALTAVMAHLQYVGVLAFEFFVQGDRLLANEIAPRVHNSGHWTIEGSAVSQFENHIRAIAGLPLGETRQVLPVAMYNLIGRMPDQGAVLAIPGCHWHSYDKQPRPERKLGHITVTAASDAALHERCAQLEPLLCNDLGG